MIQINAGGNDSRSYKGKKYGGLRIVAYAIHGTSNTTLDNDDFVPEGLTIQCNLNRSGRTHNIVASTGGPLLPAGAFPSSQWRGFVPGASTNTNWLVLLAAGVGVNEIGIIVADIPFGGIVDTTKDGTLDIAFSASNSAFSSEVNASTSYFTIEPYESEGVECGLPQVMTQVITQGEASPQFSPGSGVTRVCFINRDKTSILSADNVLSSVTVQADDVANTMNYNQLLAQRAKQFVWTEDSQRCQSFDLLPYRPGKMYFGVYVSASTVTANVNGGKNYFVAWLLKGSPSSIPTAISAEQAYKNKVTAHLSR